MPLNGGRTTSAVVRIENTVHRPCNQNSEFVHELLALLSKNGFPHSPEYLGLDGEGREVLGYIEGQVPPDLGDFSLSQINKAGSILGNLHNVTEDFHSLRGNSAVICHGDASPCNFVFRDELPVALIDFDAAFPGPRSLDYGYSVWLWSNLGSPEQDVASVALKIRAFMDGYGERATFCLDAIPEAQRWLLARLRSSKPEWMSAGIAWAQACQSWFLQNESELSRCLR